MVRYVTIVIGIALFAALPASVGSAEEVDSYDIALQAAVDRALIAESSVPDHVIEVEPYPWRDGFVRLVGSVERRDQHQRALAAALEVPGVVGVIDNITIRDLVSLPDVAASPVGSSQ